jgi:predicted transcriptional regulator
MFQNSWFLGSIALKSRPHVLISHFLHYNEIQSTQYCGAYLQPIEGCATFFSQVHFRGVLCCGVAVSVSLHNRRNTLGLSNLYSFSNKK